MEHTSGRKKVSAKKNSDRKTISGSWQVAVGLWQLACGSWKVAVASWKVALVRWNLAQLFGGCEKGWHYVSPSPGSWGKKRDRSRRRSSTLNILCTDASANKNMFFFTTVRIHYFVSLPHSKKGCSIRLSVRKSTISI